MPALLCSCVPDAAILHSTGDAHGALYEFCSLQEGRDPLPEAGGIPHPVLGAPQQEQLCWQRGTDGKQSSVLLPKCLLLTACFDPGLGEHVGNEVMLKAGRAERCCSVPAAHSKLLGTQPMLAQNICFSSTCQGAPMAIRRLRLLGMHFFLWILFFSSASSFLHFSFEFLSFNSWLFALGPFSC